jgi:hypothetical protein
MIKIAHLETNDDNSAAERTTGKLSKVAGETVDRAADATRATIDVARTKAEGAAEEQQEIMRRSVGESADVGRMFMDLLAEQTRHNMEAALAIGRAVNWTGVAEAQRDFVTGSLARMSQINQRYREIIQNGFTAKR